MSKPTGKRNDVTVAAATFEAGRQAHETNVRLRRAALEADELASRSLTSSSTAVKRRAEANKTLTRSTEALAEFERMCSYQHLRRANPERLFVDAQQQVPITDLVKLGVDRATNVDALSRVGDILQRFKRNKQVVAPLSTFAENGIKLVDKSISILRETALDGQTWANLPDALLVLFEEVVALPTTSALLEENYEQLRRMTFAVDEMTQQQEQAVSDGDMKTVEELYLKKITVQEAMVSIYNKMYAILDDHYSDAFVAPLKRVHDVHTKSATDISSILNANDNKKDRIKADLAALEHLSKSLQEENKTAEKRYQQMREASDKFLRDNQTHTDQIYAAMDELEKQLAKLASERTEAIQKRLLAVEDEEKRRADQTNFEQFITQHRQLLESTTHNLEAAEEINDLVDELLCAGCNAIEQRMRDIDATIEKERTAIHDHRLAHFRQLYLTLGDLQYKKERHIEELDKKIEQIHIQQEVAMETFNPKAKEFSQMKKDLQKVREDMNGQVNVLADKAVLQIEAFKPTEVALVESGKKFVHPVEELATRNRTRQQKLLEYHQLMQSESGSGAPGGGGAPAAADDLQKELAEIEAMKQKTIPRRPLHSSQGRTAGSSGGLGSLGSSPVKSGSGSM